ncbi:hypothetical protein BCR33DRAFT_773160 [Rhizoclosmatium globosum]|uniref:MICOS complex subunit n=1 Tax=Rhizoclosmatium globosum TaxID=329046 RepID=A0A1Y2AYF3_9FUNG|nr:hypothetical protein BCR33DRAFT_773160 [Rhizoclosmatium globosum]|eukprot:ORY27592.1 hypothetical protein BCR33DRAFT_773160 [Rhizoclosmatium globosum]
MSDGIPPRKRLSIYDEPSAPKTIPTPEPTQVELALRSSRHTVSDYFKETRATLQSYTNSYLAFEQSVIDSAKPFVTPSEPLLPNFLYVTLATCGGLVATASSKRFSSRVFVPLGLGTAAVGWWYPKTSGNLIKAAAKASGIDEQIESAATTLNAQWGAVKGSVGAAYKDANEAVLNGVASVTGQARK